MSSNLFMTAGLVQVEQSLFVQPNLAKKKIVELLLLPVPLTMTRKEYLSLEARHRFDNPPFLTSEERQIFFRLPPGL